MHITQERLKDLLLYSKHDGLFRWKRKPNRCVVVGSIAGTLSNGRIRISLDRSIYLAHRLAWLYETGSWPSGVIDHINGNPLDNRIDNLRDVPQAINLQNRKSAQRNSKSGVLGVHRRTDSSSWAAFIRINGKSKNLGSFGSLEEARAAYLSAKRAMHVGNTL